MNTLQQVWDVQTGENYPGRNPHWLAAFHAWVESHGIVKGQTWRIEHHLIDAPFVRVFQYEWNADGKVYLDPETREIARRDPYDVLVTSPPPRPEDYA